MWYTINGMKKFLIIIVIIILGILAYRHVTKTSMPLEAPINSTEEDAISESQPGDNLLGCYVAGKDQDVYTLSLDSYENGQVSGTLEFDNYQRDSSSGIFEGSYEEGILMGEYSFHSEGMYSEMQVIFKQQGEDFVRGYGELTNSGTEFADTNAINYEVDELSLFEKQTCV